MRINTNIMAENTHRHMSLASKGQSAIMEKLSSGLRINRAADDASGLSISEKMRGQIRGLRTASRNCQDGISLIQTAEGAINEITEILQRVRELAVQSANGIYTDEDRMAMQDEVSQLLEQVDTISNTTEFNGLYLLNGNVDIGSLANKETFVDIVDSITSTGGITDKYEYNGKEYASAIVDFSNLTSPSDIMKLADKGLHYTCCTCSRAYSIKFVDRDPDNSKLNDYNPVMEVDLRNIDDGEELVKAIFSTAYGDENFLYDPETNNIPAGANKFVDHFSQFAADGGKLYIYDNRSDKANLSWPNSTGQGVFKPTVFGEEDPVTPPFFSIPIHDGSNEGQNLTVNIANTNVSKLRLNHLWLTTMEDAENAITRLDQALEQVLKNRSSLGAYQNRLEHTIANLDNVAENLQSSEAHIRDGDMAELMSELTKYNIVLQSSQSMLGKANEVANSILELMK